MKFESISSARSHNLNSARPQSHSQSQQKQKQHEEQQSSPLTYANLRRQQRHSGNGVGVGGGLFGGCGFSDKDSLYSASSIRGKRIRSRNIPMKSSKSVMKKSKVMDYTNYAYNEAVGRLKLMLADSYSAPMKSYTSGCGVGGGANYLRNFSEDSADNYSDNLSVIERPVYSDISKYLSPTQKSRFGTSYRSSRKPLSGFSASKENLALPTAYQTTSSATATAATGAMPQLDYLVPSKAQVTTDSVHAPVEIFNFIEKQEDYIEQLEKESKYCRNELTNLLGKVKDVINENEALTETARSELAALTGVDKSKLNLSPSSDDSEATVYANIKKPTTPRKKEIVKSPRYANAPSIVYEARISELEAELMQANIDLKRLRTENDELKRKLAHADPVATLTGSQLVSVVNCDTHRKQIEHLQMEKSALEDTVRHLQKSLDEAKSEQYNVSSKRYFNDLLQMERSQAELEVKHLRDELDRQHERVRELQHEMARRIAEERANAERRYNSQVDQLGGDLSNQWEQVAKLQLDSERQKRYETDLKRDLANRNAQIEELKMELRSNRSTFLADMAQTNAEKQSLEQEITGLRLQLDRAAREAKTETARYTAELNSLRQRLDRGDADLLHSKREVLRLNDEIANLEKELAYGEMKNEVRPTKKDLDKRISELQDKHADTVNELEEMIQNQKQLMDKLTTECKMLTNRLEDTTLKHNQDKQRLRETNTQLLERLKQIWASYKDLSSNRRQVQKRRHSISSLGSGESTSDSCREEHFSECTTNNLIKPLSTTSRPFLMQPTQQQHQVATNYAPLPDSTITPSPLPPLTTTTPCSAGPPVPATLSGQRQLLQQLQQRLHMTSMAPSLLPRNMSQAPMPSVITNLVTASMDSATMTTKISRTTSVLARSNNNSNSSNNFNNQQQITRPVTSPPTMPTPSNQVTRSAKTKSATQQHQLQHQSTPIWDRATPALISAQQQVSPTTAPPITVLTKATIHHSTIPVPTTPAPTIKPSTTAVSTQAPARTMQVVDKATIRMPDMQTTRQPTTMPAPTNSTTQPWTQQSPHLQLHPSISSRHQHQRHRQQRRCLLQPEQSPRSLLAEQQQKAEHNRARAQELWGQQVLLEPENPRPPLKNNFAESDPSALFDSLELELSISSPSLLRSSLSAGSDCTEVANAELDSISDLSISPAPTAIRRCAIGPSSSTPMQREAFSRSVNTL